MAESSCPHKSESKRFFFKWWLCSDCYALIQTKNKEDL
jgi:hypothetical protein